MNWQFLDHAGKYSQKAAAVVVGFDAGTAMGDPLQFGKALTSILDDADAAHKAIGKDKGLSDAAKLDMHNAVVATGTGSVAALGSAFVAQLDTVIAATVPGEEAQLVTLKAKVEEVTAAALQEAQPGENWQPRGVKVSTTSGESFNVRTPGIWSETSTKQIAGVK
jgi:hypothetical protein